MAKYKVIALSVGGKKNKIYSSGDVVTESDFPEGNIKFLIDGKYVEEIGGAVTIEKVEKEESPTIEEITKKDLISELKAKGFKVDETESKKDLFEKWKSIS